MSGNCVGPNRGSSPFSLRRSALKTFSGVIGTSSMRTPTASYTAFATAGGTGRRGPWPQDRKSTRLNSSHGYISYAVFCLKKKKKRQNRHHTVYQQVVRVTGRFT